MEKFRLEALYAAYLSSPELVTDHRKISGGEGFVALKGARFDGNDFVGEALEAGASWVLCDAPGWEGTQGVFCATHSLEALQELAAYHRGHFSGKVLCVAGSNGKTTTKELLYACFKEAFSTDCTRGNFNNHIGVPLTLLSFSGQAQWNIVEIGANHPGETAFLCGLAQPDAGLVTNNGKDHLEGFGSLEGVRSANAEMFAWLATHQGMALVPDFHLDLMLDTAQQPRWVYGLMPDSEVSGQFLRNGHRAGLQLEAWEEPVWSQLAGDFNAENLMHAAAAAVWAGVPAKSIQGALANYRPALMRSQWIEKEGWRLVLDAYNANPSSMQHAVQSFARHARRPFGFFLADMLELGTFAKAEHEAMALELSKAAPDKIVLVGKEWEACREMLPKAQFFATTEEAIQGLNPEELKPIEWLFKGSRGFHLERVLENWGVW